MSGRGQITINGVARGESVELTVSDNGPGIAPALQGRIFEFDYSGGGAARNGKARRAGSWGSGCGGSRL